MSAHPTIVRSSDAAGEFRAVARVLAERLLRFARPIVRRSDRRWFELNDHLLADIGETRPPAESARKRAPFMSRLD